jgi:hypothetical protein
VGTEFAAEVGASRLLVLKNSSGRQGGYISAFRIPIVPTVAAPMQVTGPLAHAVSVISEWLTGSLGLLIAPTRACMEWEQEICMEL